MASLWQKWLTKRFAYTGEKILTQKDVLVFMYQQGYLFLVLILITFVAGVNYANNLILGFCFLISAVLCMSFYLTFKQLHGMRLEINVAELGQVGQVLHLDVYIRQNQVLTRYLWIRCEDQLYKLCVTEQKQQLRIPLHASQRGQFHYPNIQIYSIYPFGLVRAWTYLYLNKSSWIAPQVLSPELENKYHPQQFDKEMDEFRELRAFREGDSLQAVSWKQVARGQGLYIKVFEQYSDQHRIDIDYNHMPSASHEEKLSMMMGLVEQCEQQQLNYAMYLPHAELSSGLGDAQLYQAQLLLAQA
ncbi:DUF58 domain-containing protein [Acinetobacter cumulans]|uniref:DUF58 domain-containing protein n=1 Tax=Acinetobacter cumulans TaxID=2136182 RepID=A0A3A8GRD9_9GAMM|nr:DUF58 domain-containing protein [Acinetobacter cumulans]RKG55593.1 DUF58 domain-containing protein [Acinetobacter cumulans]